MLKPSFQSKPGMPNQILDCGNFYISYNDGSYPNPLGPEPETGETALIHKSEHKYYILDGDWRETYKELSVSGYDACKAFFDSKRELFGSIWSD